MLIIKSKGILMELLTFAIFNGYIFLMCIEYFVFLMSLMEFHQTLQTYTYF